MDHKKGFQYLLNELLTSLFQGGSVIRLFHKELEAYLVAEGLFDDSVTEDGKTLSHRVIIGQQKN